VTNPDSAVVIRTGFDLIIKAIDFSNEVSPTMVRRCDILEALLCSFVEHCEDVALVDNLEANLRDMSTEFRVLQ